MHLPDPLNYYEKGFFIFLLVLSLSLVSFSSYFYTSQYINNVNNPSTSVTSTFSLSIPLPDIYVVYDYDYKIDIVCKVYTRNNKPLPCQQMQGSDNITLYQEETGQKIQNKRWFLFTFNHSIDSNNIDNVIIYMTSNYTFDDISPQVLMYKREEEDVLSLNDVIVRSHSLIFTGGIHVISYSLTHYIPLEQKSYYYTQTFYDGSFLYDDYQSMLSIMPNSPFIIVNKEVVPIQPFNVFSSIWSILSLCFIVVTNLFTRQMPKIHLYFSYRNELSFIRSLCCNRNSDRQTSISL